MVESIKVKIMGEEKTIASKMTLYDLAKEYQDKFDKLSENIKELQNQ